MKAGIDSVNDNICAVEEIVCKRMTMLGVSNPTEQCVKSLVGLICCVVWPVGFPTGQESYASVGRCKVLLKNAPFKPRGPASYPSSPRDLPTGLLNSVYKADDQPVARALPRFQTMVMKIAVRKSNHGVCGGGASAGSAASSSSNNDMANCFAQLLQSMNSIMSGGRTETQPHITILGRGGQQPQPPQPDRQPLALMDKGHTLKSYSILSGARSSVFPSIPNSVVFIHVFLIHVFLVL